MILNMNEKMKKAGRYALWTVGGLILGAILLGVFNGFFGKGQWGFGWSNYNYDDRSYTAQGNCSIPEAAGVERIELDWVDGTVHIIVSPDDSYISVSERADVALTENSTLHWGIVEDGKTLSIKYRASSVFLGSGKNKALILRIPQKMLPQLQELSLYTVSAKVLADNLEIKQGTFTLDAGKLMLRNCSFESLHARSNSGEILFEGQVTERLHLQTNKGNIRFSSERCPEQCEIFSKKGNASMALGEQASFALEYAQGGLSYDYVLEKQADGTYLCNGGQCKIKVELGKSGSLMLLHKDAIPIALFSLK